ncbi:HNH endonuclease [Rugosimonospora acidiphila]|uniref:HNH endonuclease n=1 Tax=Rugosimonospora acidiphila TaxID=556531 RepID=A0ABP9RG96_9ACTN
MAGRTYGEIPGYPVGSAFVNRTELAMSKVHRSNQGGICGGQDGTESIVVSGGYVDDEDYGTEIVYTGQGGNDPATRRQIADQVLTLGNAGLARSQLEGYPVRVVRGSGGDPTWSPVAGFRYDGLFHVVDHWHEIGKDKFRIWRFRLAALERVDALPAYLSLAGPATRIPSLVQRIVRSTAVALGVKQLHDYCCQVCDIRLTTDAGPYVEAAHIRPLGRPHDGPDVATNLLALCPNHHVLFDAGAFYIADDYTIYATATGEILGRLRIARQHLIGREYLAYHRETHGT